MTGVQMKVRRQSGLPGGAPYVGVDELLYDEATGHLYGKLTTGAVVAITYPPSDAGGAGSVRGAGAVDLQYARAAAALVAAGARSVVPGGRDNAAGGDDALSGGRGSLAYGEGSLAFGDGVGTGRVVLDEGAAYTYATKTLAFSTVQDLSAVPVGGLVLLFAWAEGLVGIAKIAAVDDGADTFTFEDHPTGYAGPFGYDVAVEAVVLPSTYQGVGAAAFGSRTAAEGLGALAGGSFNFALGHRSFAMGMENIASASETAVFGVRGDAYWPSALAQSVAYFDKKGDAQTQSLTLYAQTVNATVKRLTTNNTGGHLVLQDERVYLVKALVVARASGSDNQAAYELTGLVKRGVGAATVAVVGAVQQSVIHEDVVAWDATISVNAGQGSVEVQVTGDAGEAVRWVGFVRVVEVAS